MTQKDPLADLPWPVATVAPSESCSEAIRGACTKGLCANRGVSAKARGLVTIGLSALLILYCVWYAWTVREPGATETTLLYGALGWLGAQALLIFAGLVRPPGKRGSRVLRAGLLVGASVLFLGYLALTSTEHVTFARFTEGYSGGHALGCGGVALLLGVLVGGGAMLAWRGTDPYSPGLSGALIGAVGGLASGAAVSVGCPSHEFFHACFAHGIGVFVLSAVGFALGRRLLPP